MNLVGNTIVVPAALEQPMWQALNVQQAGQLDRAVLPVGQGDYGFIRGQGYTVVTNPYLTDATDWYLLYVGGPAMRPFIYQVEKEPVLESDTNPNSRENIIKRKFLYSAYGRYNVGVTDPRLAIRIVNT